MGLHETLPMESSGKKSTFTSKEKGEKTATYNLKLNDTVSFPRLCNGLGAKPKKRPTVGINGRYVTSPGIKLTNRFLPLSEPNVTECNRQRDSTKQQMDRKTVPCVKVKDTVVLGDGAVSNININRAVTCSYPSASDSDITKLLPEVLAKHQGVKQLIVHVGAVDIRENQSEILKKDFEKLFESLDKVAIPTLISGPLPNIDRRINKFSRLLQLNTWLSKVCESRGLHFIENFNLFWQRDDLFKGKGPHLNRGAVRRLTDNLLHALRHQNGPGPGPVLPPREKRSERRAPASPPKGPAKDSTTAATAAPPASRTQDSAAPPSPSPRPSPQAWDPPAASTPSRNVSLSFSSPLSPMRFPDRLESLVKSGIKMVPLTPNMARSRILSSKKHRAPLPPQPTPPTKAPPARPPPSVPTAVISNSINAVV